VISGGDDISDSKAVVEQMEGYQDEIYQEISRFLLSLKTCGGEILDNSMEREFLFHSYFPSDLTFFLYFSSKNLETSSLSTSGHHLIPL
jgi:hypothetical protein